MTGVVPLILTAAVIPGPDHLDPAPVGFAIGRSGLSGMLIGALSAAGRHARKLRLRRQGQRSELQISRENGCQRRVDVRWGDCSRLRVMHVANRARSWLQLVGIDAWHEIRTGQNPIRRAPRDLDAGVAPVISKFDTFRTRSALELHRVEVVSAVFYRLGDLSVSKPALGIVSPVIYQV